METKKGLMIGISVLVGLGTLTGMAFGTHNYFQTDAEAAVAQESNNIEHFRLASDNERGRLENELKTVNLEIDFLLRLKESGQLSTRDASRLEYLKKLRSNLEERLRDMAAANKMAIPA